MAIARATEPDSKENIVNYARGGDCQQRNEYTAHRDCGRAVRCELYWCRKFLVLVLYIELQNSPNSPYLTILLS